RRGVRHDHAFLQRLGDTSRTFREHVLDDVRLLEVRVIGVEDQRPLLEGELHDSREALVPPLGRPGHVERGERFGGVVVDVEVRRVEDLPVELLVLHLVASEVLGFGGCRREAERCCGERERGEEPRNACLTAVTQPICVVKAAYLHAARPRPRRSGGCGQTTQRHASSWGLVEVFWRTGCGSPVCAWPARPETCTPRTGRADSLSRRRANERERKRYTKGVHPSEGLPARIQRSGGTTSVGTSAPRYTLSATLPTTSRVKPSRALVLMAMTSAPHSPASSRIAAPGDAWSGAEMLTSTVEGRLLR